MTVTAPVTSVLATGTVTLSATPRDAAGNSLSGRATTWSTSPATVATVSTSGVVTALAPGAVTITATSEGQSGSVVLTVVDPRNIPFFEKPFAGEWEVGNFLDHNIPKEFVDNNETFTGFWGEVHPETGGMTDGHSGYDWFMPIGTPLLAMGPGVVKRVDLVSQSFFCPVLNRNVNDQMSVFIEHTLPGGVILESWYVHLSRIDVTVGQALTTGQVIGLAGNTGCSTSPHLHLEVFRMNGDARRTLDPYGWTGAGTDPWESHVDGTASIQLWKPGKAPVLQREINIPYMTAPALAPLVLTKIVYEGVNDATNPNNEYAELTLDTRVASTRSLNGFGFKPQNQTSLAYTFPTGITLTAAQPTVRVYTGAGTNSGLTLYMGKAAGIWNNNRNKVCAVVTFPTAQSGVYLTCP
ncbi:MAG: peptidoglycan DD-metalloendopeptidase family protein [Gemmatimonas sp.]